MVANMRGWHARNLFSALLGYFIILETTFYNNQISGNGIVCLMKECMSAAANITSKMNRQMDPCSDFYEFACGKYIAESIIPKDEVSISSFSIISNTFKKQLRDIISLERTADQPEVSLLPNLFYKACMDMDIIEELGTKPLTDIAEAYGGWPVIKGNAWNTNKTWSWPHVLKGLSRRGYNTRYLFSVDVMDDIINGTKSLINLDRPMLGLEGEYLVNGLEDRHVNAYYDYMVDIAVLFGAEMTEAKDELLESLQFEISLANISLSNEERRNISTQVNYCQLKEVQSSYPYFEWMKYLNGILPKDVRLSEDDVVNVVAIDFLSDLEELLAITPDRVKANYIMWRLHKSSVSLLSENFREREFKYESILSGQNEQEARWKYCADTAASSLRLSVGSLYVQTLFNEESKDAAAEMANNLKDAFESILKSVDWMDDQTRQEALNKLKAMKSYIGYPKEILNHTVLSEYYAGLSVNPSKYFETYLSIKLFSKDKSFRKLKEPLNQNEWVRHSNAVTINAFYSPFDNSIELPASILQGHLFNAKLPKYMNFGAIGYVIGHEITHGFDDIGRQFDTHGRMREWWEPKTRDLFFEKARCFIDLYGNYTDKLTGLKLNGLNTLGENIADNGGIKASYLAYKKWMSEYGLEPKLPGLEDFSGEQMFWISAAQNWCGKFDKDEMERLILSDFHSPINFRVMGPFSNSKHFAKDFQCREGAVMNPVNKCELW